jgi:hypothetical protein
MKACPRCNSNRNVRRGVSPSSRGRDHAGKVIGHSLKTGHPLMAATVLALKAAKELGLYDYLDGGYYCESCRHSFT